MEMMVITKFDWKIEETTCMDFLFSLFDFSTLGSSKRIGTRTKNIIAHFLASQLTKYVLIDTTYTLVVHPGFPLVLAINESGGQPGIVL